MIGKIQSRLEQSHIRSEENCSLRELVSFRLESEAALAVFPRTRQELAETWRICQEYGVRCVLLGNGSNLFFACRRFEGVVLVTKEVCAIGRRGESIFCDCGTSLTALTRYAAQAGLSGLEFAFGIPGTVGGAVYMNAGAYGGAVADVLSLSVAYDARSGEEITISDHGFGYRRSIYMEDPALLCLGAEFCLKKEEPEVIRQRMAAHMAARREKQPLELPSAGSYFKRPEGNFAGRLIEECGLKGFRVGGAAVSEKHAGFLVNAGGATWEDVLKLEEEVRRRVAERFGVTLEREVQVIS